MEKGSLKKLIILGDKMREVIEGKGMKMRHLHHHVKNTRGE